ncbi:hypothetical protein RI054_16g75950 [Pseudoscourfieldia marina]
MPGRRILRGSRVSTEPVGHAQWTVVFDDGGTEKLSAQQLRLEDASTEKPAMPRVVVVEKNDDATYVLQDECEDDVDDVEDARHDEDVLVFAPGVDDGDDDDDDVLSVRGSPPVGDPSHPDPDRAQPSYVVTRGEAAADLQYDFIYRYGSFR